MSFEDFKNIEDEMHLISSSFACNVDNTPIDVQLDWFEFYSSLKEENFPNMKKHAQKMLVLSGSTYTCEHTFSVMKFTKSR